jgi:hypothetical protein
MTQQIKQIIAAVVIIVVAFIGFRMFSGGESSSETIVTDNRKAQFVDGQAVLNLLNRLNKVELKDDVFSSAAFTSLVSFEVAIPDQVLERPNPFAPIGSDGAQ